MMQNRRTAALDDNLLFNFALQGQKSTTLIASLVRISHDASFPNCLSDEMQCTRVSRCKLFNVSQCTTGKAVVVAASIVCFQCGRICSAASNSVAGPSRMNKVI